MNRTAVCIGIFSLAILGASARAEEKLHHNAAAIQKANAGVTAETPNAQSDANLVPGHHAQQLGSFFLKLNQPLRFLQLHLQSGVLPL